jgi:hypothetical protein
MKAVLPYLLCATTALAGCSHIANEFPVGPYFISGRATTITGDYVRSCEEVMILRASTKLAGKIDALTQASQSSLVNDVYMDDLIDDPDFARLSKSVDCDAQGKFTLVGVPDGHYYLIAQVTWLLRWGHRGGYIIRQIDVSSSIKDIEIAEVDRANR